MIQQNWGARWPLCISSLPSLSGRIFTKVVLEAPLITESALEVIRKYCEDEVRMGDRSLSALSIMVQAGALLTAAYGRETGPCVGSEGHTV